MAIKDVTMKQKLIHPAGSFHWPQAGAVCPLLPAPTLLHPHPWGFWCKSVCEQVCFLPLN